MKKIISKILIIFIIIVILFEFTYSNNICYAFDSEDINSITNLIGGITSIILWIPRILVTGMAWVAGTIMTDNLAENCGVNDGFTDTACATPFDIFFNKYKLFDVNFFDITTEDNVINNIRTQVAQWFYTFRTIAAVILLVILIYVGIRMAISTIAEDKAKYKKMLIDWCCSLALIFVLQYIAIFTIYANNAIVNFLRQASQNDLNDVIGDIMGMAMGGMGIGSLVATFVYCMIIFQTIAFMITYIQRMLKVGFLLIIAPLISITYSIDKMGDGKAQALNIWLKEFVYTILIQPFHCIMYLAFVDTAVGLLTSGATISDVMNEGLWDAIGNMNQLANGFLAILCLKFINDGEKAIRKIFNVNPEDNLTSMAAGAAVGMAALANAKKIGSATAKTANKVRSIPTKFGKAINKDKDNNVFGKIKDTFKLSDNAQQKIQGLMEKAPIVNNAIKTGSTKLKNFGEKASSLKNKAGVLRKKRAAWMNAHPGLKKTINGAKTFGGFGGRVLKRSMPIALGMMGAAMSYATGTSGAMEAIGVGSGMSKGSEQFFESTQGHLEAEGARYLEDAVEDEVNKDEKVQSASEALEDNIENFDNASKNLKNTNSEIKKLSKGQRTKGNEYLALQKEKDKLRAEKAQINQRSSGGETSEKDKNRLKEIEQRRKEIESREDELKADPEFNSRVQKLFDTKYEDEKIIQNHKELENNLFEAKAAARVNAAKNAMETLKQNGADYQIAAAKTEILKAIQKHQLQRKLDAGGDTSADFELSESEISSSERMQKSICDLLDRSIIGSGASFDIGDFMSKQFSDTSDSDISESLRSAIDEYQFQKNAQMFNATRSNAQDLGMDKDKFDSDVVRKVTGLNG